MGIETAAKQPDHLLSVEERAGELWACLALRHTPGLGPKTESVLFQTYGSARQAIAASGEWQERGLVRDRPARAFSQRHWEQGATREWTMARDKRMQVVLRVEALYPERLRQIAVPPPFLYAYGEIGLLHSPCVAIVGSRHCSREGRQTALDLASGLSQAGVTVVSGFAQGIDSAAHKGAVNQIGSSIAVMGSGLDIVYPAHQGRLWRELLGSGLMVSEFSPGSSPEAGNFPRRNRVISGLSLAVVVLEAAEESGSLITASLALEQDREVFVVPGPVYDSNYAGSNALIRDGARLVRQAEDILEDLSGPLAQVVSAANKTGAKVGRRAGAEKPKPGWQAKSELERAVFDLLAAKKQVHIDVLLRQSGCSSQDLHQLLLVLEMQGVVEQHPGLYYSLSPGFRP